MHQTVLLIDDSKPIHQLIKTHLEDEPLTVHSAYDGPSGLALAASLKPDLILLDVDMPGMNGYDVCRLLKIDPATAESRVVFLTASGSIDEKICGLDLQAVDYITKPFDPTELRARIRSALRKGPQVYQTVLMVDDFKPIHQLVKTHLAEEPLVIHSAYDGPSGLATATSLHPDLILLDVDMPGMNGFDVCRLLKANRSTADIRIIFLTAASSIDDKVCGLELQAVDYITKPFDPEELRARVRAAFRTKLLLGLLPKSEAQANADLRDQGTGVRSLNARMSIAQLTLARAANPWNRRPPVPTGSVTQSVVVSTRSQEQPASAH